MSYASVGQHVGAECQVNKVIQIKFWRLLFLNCFSTFSDASRNCKLEIIQLFSLEETTLRASEMPETFFTFSWHQNRKRSSPKLWWLMEPTENRVVPMLYWLYWTLEITYYRNLNNLQLPLYELIFDERLYKFLDCLLYRGMSPIRAWHECLNGRGTLSVSMSNNMYS